MTAMAGMTGLAGFREIARERLGGFPYTTVADAPGMRRAAVVLCVVADERGTLNVIIIKRAFRGRNAGQWGLPGGRLEDGETLEQAALRELGEEIGLDCGPEDVLGRLDDFPATSGFAITPIVAAPADPGPLRPSPAEVHSVHPVSLERLAAEDTPRWVLPPDALPQAVLRARAQGDGGGLGSGSGAGAGAAAGSARPDDAGASPRVKAGVDMSAAPGARVLQMHLDDDMVIHAPTGAVLWQFREVVLLGSRPEDARVADFLQPSWTRR